MYMLTDIFSWSQQDKSPYLLYFIRNHNTIFLINHANLAFGVTLGHQFYQFSNW